MSTATAADSAIPAPRSSPPRRRTLYRGDPGMWSWVVRGSPEAYNQVIDTYKTPLIGLMEMGLVVAVLYHALNGIRVILIDFWQHGPKYQRLILWIVLGVWISVFIVALGVLGMHMAERFL